MCIRDRRYGLLCRICLVHIKPSNHVQDHAHYSALTRQHEPDHTDKEPICPGWRILLILTIKWEAIIRPRYGRIHTHLSRIDNKPGRSHNACTELSLRTSWASHRIGKGSQYRTYTSMSSTTANHD